MNYTLTKNNKQLTMEQQQNDLFAMIGELTYKLQLTQTNNERLADESLRMREALSYTNKEYNTIFTTCNSLRSENAELRANIARIEDERNRLEEVMGIFRPQRQRCDDRLTVEDLVGVEAMDTDTDFDSDDEIDMPRRQYANNLTDEDIARFYEEEAMEIDDQHMSELYEEAHNEATEDMTNEEMEWMYSQGFMDENQEPYPEWA
jgi:chromosome segregation ATPase